MFLDMWERFWDRVSIKVSTFLHYCFWTCHFKEMAFHILKVKYNT